MQAMQNTSLRLAYFDRFHFFSDPEANNMIIHAIGNSKMRFHIRR